MLHYNNIALCDVALFNVSLFNFALLGIGLFNVPLFLCLTIWWCTSFCYTCFCYMMQCCCILILPFSETCFSLYREQFTKRCMQLWNLAFHQWNKVDTAGVSLQKMVFYIVTLSVWPLCMCALCLCPKKTFWRRHRKLNNDAITQLLLSMEVTC